MVEAAEQVELGLHAPERLPGISMRLLGGLDLERFDGGGDEAEERQRLEAVIAEFAGECDIVLADCPGADTMLARAAHARAHPDH